jgi:hypothetical protein
MDTCDNNTTVNTGTTPYGKVFRNALIVTIIGVIVFTLFSHCYHSNQAYDIIAQQDSAYAKLVETINALKPDTLAGTYQIDPVVLQQIERNQSYTHELLELQFERQQAERNILEIWGAVITIVFLVFSLYSSFRIDEMQKQAQSTLNKLEALHAKAENESANIKGVLSGILKPYEEKAKELIKQINKLEQQIGTIGDIPQKLAKFEEIENIVQQNKDNLKTLTEDTHNLAKTILRLEDDVKELSFDDSVGDENKNEEE